MTATRLTDYGSIVFLDQIEGRAIVWNGGATFNVFLATGNAGWWDNVDCFTVYGVDSLAAAQRVADSWFADARAESLALEDDPVPLSVIEEGLGY